MKKLLIILTAVLVCHSLQAQNNKKNQSKTDKEYEQKKAALYEEFKENGKWHNAVIPPDRIRAMKIKKQIDSLTKVRDSLMHYTDSLIAISDNNRKRINNDINSLRKDYYAVSESALEDVYRIKKGHTKDSLEKILANLSPKIRKSKAAQRIKEYLTEESLKAGDKFQEFTCYTLDGKKFNWKSIRGKRLFIILDGYDCMGSHMNPLAFKNYYKNEIEKKIKGLGDFVFIPYFSEDSFEKFKKDADYYGMTEYNPVSDMEGNLTNIDIIYNVKATPTCLYVNADGTIKAITEGFEPKDLEEFLK
ncbi:MAG: hypothetical protein IK103_04695 [Bacteroidales bacterium]|nr:hypothetical protein [Bacteroidales bacterium]